MAEFPPKVINVPGAVPGIPKIPDFSGPTGPASPAGNPVLGLREAFDQVTSRLPEGGLEAIPLWSFHHGNRYDDSRPFSDFEEAAAMQQPWTDKLGNGLTKMFGIGGLSIVGGTLGVLNGIGQMAFGDRKFSSLWNNPTTRLLSDVQTQLEDAMPNYRTRAETDANWYSPQYLMTANFLADDVLKNLGYAIGMIYSGKAWTEALKMANIGNKLVAAGQGLETATAMERAISTAPKLNRFGAVSETLNSLAQKYLRQPVAGVLNQGDRLIGSVMGMFSEAGIESMQGANEFRDSLIQKFVEENGYRPEGEDLDKINELSNTVGNYIWGMNAALLSTSNYIQLPKILSSSRKVEKSLINGIEKEAGKPLADYVKSVSFLEKYGGRAGRFTDKTFGRLLRYGFSPVEALEEGSQFAVQTGVKDYFQRAYENPQDGTSLFKSVMQSLQTANNAVVETLSTNEGMKNLLIGGLSGGIMTIPGNYFQGRMKDANTDAAIQALNKTKMPAMLKDMAGYALRGMESQKRRQEAIIDNDILTEKDEEQNYLFSYLMPRIKYGKLENVKEELNYYRQQSATESGFNELVSTGIVNAGESREDFLFRLNAVENRAEALDKTYSALYDKYANVYDKDKKRVYSDDVIDKMAYASAKIVDYDERLADLQLKLEGNGVEAYSLKEALYQSGSWQEGKINAIGREEGVTKAIAKIIEDIETKDVVKDKKQDLKNDFNDYLEMSLRRKAMMEDYNAMLDKPEMFTENYISEKFDLDVSGEPIEITKEMSVKPGEKYIVGNNVEFDEEGNKKERAKELTIVQETTDGKIAVANEKGIMEMLTREELQDYMVQKADDNLSVTGKFFRDFNGHRFQYNFGPKSGTREGRLIYNPVTDKITFVTDDGYTPLRRIIDGSFLVSKEQGGKGRMTVVRTAGETREQVASYEEFTSAARLEEEAAKNNLANTKDERADIINELYNSSKESLERIKKQVQEKRDRLLDIGRKIKEIRGQERTSFSKMLAASTSGLTALYNLAKQIKKDLESLKAQQAKVEFNLEYFQQMKEDLSTLPEQPEALVKELESQLKWVDKIEGGFKSEVAHYESLADRVKKTIEQLAEFLKNAIQRFDSKYPTYIRDSFDRMIDNGDLLSEIPVVKEYLADYALLEDTKKDIAVNKPYAQELETRLKAAADELAEINKERTALNDVLNEFKQVVARHKAAKEAEEKLRQDAEFQKQMDDQQTKTQAASGLIVDSPATPEGLEEEQTTSDEKDARKYINVVYSATVNSSKRARKPSVIRHDQFMEKVDFLPTKVRSKLRRIFVTANNEKALGLEGVINAYQEGYVPPEGEETVLAVYVKMEGTGYSFIDVDGNSVAKPTDENIDLSKLVFTTMPAPNESLPGYGFRYNEKATANEVKAYLGAYVRWRERLFGMKDRTYPPEEFFVSRGILYKSKNKNHIVGNLMTQKQFEDGLPVIVVATADAIIHQNIEVTAKRGRVYIQNGGILQQVNTRNLTKEEVETVFEVLKEFVRKATVDKVWDPKLTQFLQGILYFQSPYQKIGEEVTKKEVSANQMYFRSGSFYMGKEEVPIPFSVSGLIDNEALVKDFLSKAYHHVNNSFAKNNTPFTSYTLDENKNLQPKTWTYQAYMLSPEGRTPEQAPLHTNARPVSSDVANDAKFEPGSRYTYSFNMLEVSAEDLAELVPTEQNPDKEAQTRTESDAAFNEVAIEEDSPMAQALAAVRRAAQAAEQQKGTPAQPKAATFTPTTPFGTPTSPQVTTAVSDIEAKKADIERERQEMIRTTDFEKSEPDTLDKINAKYDAELAALEGEEVDTVQEVQTRLNEDLSVTSKISIDAYLNGLHYVQTEDGKYYVIPDSNASGYESVNAKEVTKEQIIRPFRTEAEWKKVGIGVAALQPTAPVSDIEAKRKEVRAAIQKAGQGEGGQFFVTLADGTKESAARISLSGNELGVGNKGVTVDLSTIVKIENPDGSVVYDSTLEGAKPITQAGSANFVNPAVRAEQNEKIGDNAKIEVAEQFNPKETKKAPSLEELRKQTPETLEDLNKKKFRIMPTIPSFMYALADVRAEKKYIEERTPFKVETIESLIQAGNGIYAFGSYLNGLIELSDRMEIGTGYHEMFEGIFDVFLSPKEKRKLFNEFARREGTFVDRETGKTVKYKDATAHQAIEEMAEEFRRFKLYNQSPPKAKTSLIRQFFETLMNWINSIFNGDIKNLTDLFSKMDAGLYSSVPFRDAPSMARRFREKIGTLTVQQAQVVVDNVVSRVFQNITYQGRTDILNKLDFSDFSASEVYAQVYKDLQNHFLYTLPNMLKEQGVPTEEYENMILPVWMSISSNWGLTKQYGTEMLKTFNIIQKNTDEDGVQQDPDIEGEETDYAGGKSEDSYLQDSYMYDARQNAPASIKIAIATIQESVWVSAENAAFKAGLLNINERSLTNVLDPSTGLEVLVNFTKMFNRLMIKLHSVNTLKEKEAIVEEMANANPNFYKLYNRLKMGQTTGLTGDDWALKVKAYTTFAKQQTEGLIIYMQPDGTSTIGASDLHDSVKRSINEWFTRFQKNENLVKYSSEKKRFEFIGRSLVRATNNIPSQFKFLADLGINFSPVQMANVTAKQQEKLLKAINNIKSVIRNRYSLDATSLKTLDLTGNLRPIFEVYLESQNLEPESTYRNMDGQMAPSYLQTNTFSRVINDMNSAQTKQQLMENVSILSNPYSLDSVILNKMFDAEGDKVGAETSGVEEFRQGLFVEGTIDEYGDGVTTETMLEPQRLMQAIVMNLSGYYYMLIPAEGKREHMLNMPNLYENLETALPQMWSYYQTEVRLGGTEGRFFNFLANDLTQEQFNREFTKFVDNEVTAQFNQLSDVNIIEENVQKEEGAPSTYKWKGLPKNFLARGYKSDQLSMEQLAEILTFRTVNFFANNVEIQKMFFGDPKDIDDPTKRIKSFGSPTEQAVYDVPEWDAELNAMYNTVAGVSLRPGDPGYHIHKNSLTTVTLEDNITENQYLQTIREELKMGENYGETNSTDAQGIAPLSGFKHMQLKNGNRWNDNAEAQYQFEMARDRIYMEMDGFFSYEGIESLKKQDQALLDKGDPALATFVPLKPKVSGYYGDKAILDKYSIAPITYYGVRGKNLAGQYIRMLKQGVDYTIFRSGRKIGATDGDAYYTSDGDPNTQPYKDTAMIEVPFKWFGIQVETQSSKTTSTLGSQLSKAATINILDAGVPRDVEMSYDEWAPLSEEEKLAKSDLYKKYNAEKEARQALSDWGYDHVMDRLGLKEDGKVDAEKVLELIKDQLTRRQLNDNIRAALKIDPETKTFRLPLETLNNYEEIKSVLFAYIDKSISSSKVNGGSRVQVSGSGFEAAGKRIVAKKIKNKKGKEVTVWVSSGLAFYTKEKPYCEVLIPFIYGKRLRDAGIDITSEEVLRNLMTTEEGRKILRGVGFRIPTQELNSVEVFVIAGFLPESYGNMIVVPEDLTTKSGGDFDVDKLQTYLKNIYIDGNGEIRLVPFFGYGAEAKRKIEEMWDRGEFLKPAERRELDRIIDEERIALEDEDVYLKLFLNIKGISNLFSEEQITKEFMSIKDKGDFKKYAIESLYKQSIENQYFQAVEDLLTLEINFERLVAPNSAKELKDVRDTLVKISEEEFGDGAVKSLGSPTYMNRQRHAYLLSKGGVGIPASNQTNHAMVQKVPVIIDPSAIQDLDDDNERKYIQDASFKLPTDRITLKGKTYATLSRVFDRAGRYISAKISQYIDGFVDVIKDPFLVQIGVNRGNAGTFLFLERMQVPTNVVIMFMNQPIIREFNKILARNSTTYPYREDFIAEAKAYFPTSRTVTSYRNAEDYNALAKELEGNIQKYYGDKQTKFSDEEAAYQQFILDEYLKYAVMSSNLLRFSQALNYDTTSFTNRHVLDKKLRDTNNASVNNIFKSADDVLKATYMGRVKENLEQAFTRVSKSLFKFLADDVKENISPIISEIMDRRGMKMRDKLLLVRRVEQSFISYLIHETNSLQSFANSLLINEDTALINTEYQNIMAEVSKSVFSPLAKNVVLTTMGSEDIKEPIDTKIVRLYERSRDARSQNQYIAAMEELRDNPITAEFYKKLVRLAFIQSGIRTSPISFTDIIPVEDFSPYVMAALKGLNNQGLLQDFIKSDTFYRNNWSNRKLVPRLRGKKVRDFSKTKEGAELNKFAEATGMQVKAFMVYTASREWNSSHIAVEDGRGDQKTTILLKKLESDGQPVLFKKTFKNGKTLTYGLYVSENAWGDAEKAEEHYRNPRKSEFNNRTFKMEREFSTAELLFILKGEWNKVAPENPSLVPMEEQQATVGEMDPNIEQPTVLGTETIPYTPSQSPDEFTFKDGTTVATPFNLNPEQREALFKLEEFYKNPSKMNNQITLQGYAGTGKTSVIAIFDKYLKSKYVRPYYTAPTHRANAVTKLNNPSARVLTLHALFGLAPNFEIENGDYSVEDLEYAEKNQPKIESGDLLIVDEASMVNKALNEYLRRAKADDNISIVYVGDPGQLKPPKDPDVSPVFTEGEQIYLTKVERTGDNAILEESTNLRNGKDFAYQTKVKDNIGVEYISGDAQARKVVAENFNSEEFKRNKLYFRVLAAKNREVQSMNRLVRDTLYDTTAQLVNGEILMGYSNWAVDYATKEPKIINGGDYQVTTFTEGTKTVSIGTERVQFNGYDAVVKNLLNPNAKAERVFIVDNNESDLKIDKFVNKISSLRKEAARIITIDRSKAAKMFQEARDLENMLAFMKDLKDDSGRYKVRKTFDYGYAHTIHKSQGGTYTKVLVLANTIDGAFDPETQQQLKYVAMSRATDFVYVSGRANPNPTARQAAAAQTRPAVIQRVSAPAPAAQATAGMSPFEAAMAAAARTRGQATPTEQPTPPAPAPTVATSKGFQGYKGGFENIGKGTIQGDGKDKAMRRVANSAIVELSSEKDSSSKTSLGQLGLPKEGDKVIMLARNGALSGNPLRQETKEQIRQANLDGAEFVVGDMPNVDSQFIDYLQEIGAKFTIYHTGDKSRITIPIKSTLPAPAQPAPVGEQSKFAANIPQNKVSGVESYGSTVIANDAAIKALGPKPHSIDMIEAGFRTRTTRSADEMAKYGVKVGDTIKHFGRSADGSTKTVFAKVTAIHPKGSPGWKGTWAKEGWRAEDVNVIDRFKDGAAAIEFEVILPTAKKTYTGKIEKLQPNQVFVFGSNPEGRHGAGAAQTAQDKFGAQYGKGRGLQGQSYALVTKNLKAGFTEQSTGITYNKAGERSVSPEQIKANIQELYKTAKQNPGKEFLVAYSATGKNLNGYSAQEMADMFSSSEIPSNMVFEEGFSKLLSKPAKKTDTGQQIDIEPGYGLTKENFETTAEEAVKEAVPTPTDNRTDQEIMDSPEFKKYIEDMPFWVEMSYALETFKKCKL